MFFSKSVESVVEEFFQKGALGGERPVARLAQAFAEKGIAMILIEPERLVGAPAAEIGRVFKAVAGAMRLIGFEILAFRSGARMSEVEFTRLKEALLEYLPEGVRLSVSGGATNSETLPVLGKSLEGTGPVGSRFARVRKLDGGADWGKALATLISGGAVTAGIEVLEVESRESDGSGERVAFKFVGPRTANLRLIACDLVEEKDDRQE